MIGSALAAVFYFVGAVLMFGLEERRSVRRFSSGGLGLLSLIAAAEAMEAVFGPWHYAIAEFVGWMRLSAALSLAASVLSHFEIIFAKPLPPAATPLPDDANAA